VLSVCFACLLIADSIWLVAVAALWGFTNPFLKSGGKGIEQVRSSSRLLKPFYELLFLVSNWKVCHICAYVTVFLPEAVVYVTIFHLLYLH